MIRERFRNRSGTTPEVITNRSASRARACVRNREQGREQGTGKVYGTQVQNGSVSYASARLRIGLGS